MRKRDHEDVVAVAAKNEHAGKTFFVPFDPRAGAHI